MEQQTHHEPRKSFFEKYQLFIAIVACGILIGGGIVIAEMVSSKGGAAGETAQAQTQESVRADMIRLAKKAGASKNEFAACLDNGDQKQKIADDVALANDSGVSGTPTFFVIKRTYGADDRIVSEKQFPILGARDLATFEQAIESGKAPSDQPPMPTGKSIELSAEDHWLGPRRAETILVEYSDIDCPFCKRAEPTIDELLKKHPEIAFVYRHAPIASLHPFAEYKAEASECVAQIAGEDAFWDFLFAAI